MANFESLQLTSVTSDGVCGPDAVTDLKNSGYYVHDWAVEIIADTAHPATTNTVYKPVVLKGEITTFGRNWMEILKVAEREGLIIPPVEIARLVRKSVSDEDMANMKLDELFIMHYPFKFLYGISYHLLVIETGDRVHASSDQPYGGLPLGAGFVFLAK